ncbi:hypothetical protein CBR_g36440 [Chara braunii]|uniref:Uncharacterized protein n=1 Tax=Chara braunii TaxID=69332 RepID=A0A388LKZ9_CHABU|nr:hypothetical protein CBR_g36440 [Chara braunii]|eukprot:GBG82913.1 hypothetical protein CBR_g36440 [Chara braunii]
MDEGEKLRGEVFKLERELAKEDSPEKEKEELRRKLAQLRKLKEKRDLARVRKKTMEAEIEWELEQTRREVDLEDQYAPSSSTRPPRKRRTETPSTPLRPRRVRQPNMGIHIEEPSTPRTAMTTRSHKKNPIINNETLLAGWRDITRNGAGNNVVGLCMNMRSYLGTKSMAELQCLCGEENVEYVTREKATKSLISNKMQEKILRGNAGSVVDPNPEVSSDREPDLETN